MPWPRPLCSSRSGPIFGQFSLGRRAIFTSTHATQKLPQGPGDTNDTKSSAHNIPTIPTRFTLASVACSWRLLMETIMRTHYIRHIDPRTRSARRVCRTAATVCGDGFPHQSGATNIAPQNERNPRAAVSSYRGAAIIRRLVGWIAETSQRVRWEVDW